jgi:hypothetical protein
MTVGGTILFLRAKPDPKREYSARATASPIEGELNLQPAGCAEKRLAIREEWLSESPRKRKYRAAEKEMNIETSHGSAIVPENFGNVAWYQRGSPMLAHHAEVEIADVFARKRDGGGKIRRAQRYFPLKTD